MTKRRSSRIPGVGTARELTIDQLAAAAQMTVRNVRAYAGRGLIPAPRLVGRTGYYNKQHVDRLLLIRDLLDRGYTLAAIEEALEKNTGLVPSHALDLLTILDAPRAPQEPERLGTQELARLAGVEHDPEFIDRLAEAGLLSRVGPDELLLHEPAIVRAGAQAMALGLSRDSVLALLPFISERMEDISARFIEEVLQQLWLPFAEEGFPAEEWPEMLRVVEQLLPIAGQAVMAIFRRDLNRSIDAVLGSELERIAGQAAEPQAAEPQAAEPQAAEPQTA